MPDIIALRASPDWLNFDLAEARPFLKSIGFALDMLDQFVELWDRNLAVDYRTFRHRLKLLALETAAATTGALLDGRMVGRSGSPDRIVFLDDDDWLAPDLFENLAPAEAADGQRWSSVRIGLDYDPTSPDAAVIQCRPPSRIVYTNNYMVTGDVLRGHGVDAVFEHTNAQSTFDREDFTVIDMAGYYSCAVKHPCSTTAVRHLMSLEEFRRDPKSIVQLFAQRLVVTPIPSEATWIGRPVSALVALLEEAARA